MNKHTQLKSRIMRRVYFWYIVNRVKSPLARLVVLVFSLGILSQIVSVGSIVENASRAGGVVPLFMFFVDALQKTEGVVIFFFSIIIFLVAWSTAEVIERAMNRGSV